MVINYKSYASGYGQSGVRIAKGAQLVAEETGLSVIVAVPYTMIPLLSRETSLLVFAQHVDPLQPGRGTGYVTPREVALAGARGSILNHSERRMDLSSIERAIFLLHEEGLLALACAETPATAAALAPLKPDIIAMEPPELIATGISVSRAKPEVVTAGLRMLRDAGYAHPVIVGAGVTVGEDARRAVELGADGVMVSSSVMTSNDPVSKVRELAEGLLGAIQ